MIPFLKKKRRALLLEDDPSMQRLVSTLLKREGYRVDVFLTGRDAIRALESDPFDVLLLDLMMPHEGGMTVIRHLRSKAPELLKRVLVVTGSPKSVVGTVRNEVAGVVQKPFEASELIGAIQNVTRST
jgi:DNA-binding response OmpR family regulator